MKMDKAYIYSGKFDNIISTNMIFEKKGDKLIDNDGNLYKIVDELPVMLKDDISAARNEVVSEMSDTLKDDDISVACNK